VQHEYLCEIYFTVSHKTCPHHVIILSNEGRYSTVLEGAVVRNVTALIRCKFTDV
jgi:hypothetical protein